MTSNRRIHGVAGAWLAIAVGALSSCSGAERASVVEKAVKEAVGYSMTKEDRQTMAGVLKAGRADVEPIAQMVRKDKKRFLKLTEGLEGRGKFHLLMLQFVRPPVERGCTDDWLLYVVTDGRLTGRIDQTFAAPAVARCQAALDELSPESLKGMLDLLAGVSFEGTNPHGPESTTWAARSLASVATDLTYARLARGSVAARLLAAKGIVKPPRQTTARFAWSGRPPVVVRIRPMQFAKSDTAGLTRMLESRHAVYRSAAKEALMKLTAPAARKPH